MNGGVVGCGDDCADDEEGEPERMEIISVVSLIAVSTDR